MGEKLTVRFVDSYERSDDLAIVPKYGYASFSTSGVKRYHAVLMTLCGVSGVARDLMDWLTAQMDNDNRVYNTKATRCAFISFLSRAGKKKTTHSSINAAFAGLRKKGLLIDLGRSCFMVNPEYFINSANEESRSRLIKMVLEFENNANTTIKVNIKPKKS